MSELQRPGVVTKSSTSGKQQITGPPPHPPDSELNVPNHCSQTKRATTLADQTSDRVLEILGADEVISIRAGTEPGQPPAGSHS
jgi:hypothetical protein